MMANVCQTTVFKVMNFQSQLLSQHGCKVLEGIYEFHDNRQTPSAGEDHVISLKTPEQLLYQLELVVGLFEAYKHYLSL